MTATPATDASITLDQPEQIMGWYYLSAVSQLTLEIKTKTNFYGKRSAYAGIRGRIIPAEMLPARATRANKVLALTLLCYGQEPGPVIDSARALLREVLETEGIGYELADA